MGIGTRVNVIALALVVSLGCAGRSRGTASTPTPPPTTAAPLSMAILGAGAGGVAGRDALDRLFEAPEVTAAGERLLDRLGAAPSLEPRYATFVENVMSRPAMVEAYAALAASNPGGSVEQLTEQIGARLSEGIDGPAFDGALDRALDRLLDRPAVDGAFGELAQALIDRGRFLERLAALLQQWQPDIEAAVGVPMMDERFDARLEQYLDDPARSGALEQALTERIADDPKLRAALAGLLDDDAFFAACETLFQGLLDDPQFQDAATSVLAGLVMEVDATELEARVDRLLVTPDVEHSVVRWAHEVGETAAFDSIADQLGALLDDPNVQGEMFDALVGTVRQQTA
ncbi:MAG: hypothetical protein K0V04_04530 [Deltaproteobacteria bacterium]|nr:hypothetical protein [Deltaproteobacteria bacterium]